LLTRTATMENISLCGPMKSNCVCGIATGDTRVRGEFDFVMAAQKRMSEKPTAFLELEAAIHRRFELLRWKVMRSFMFC